MNPKDVKTIADVIRWLKSHVEWSDCASEDMMLAAVAVLEKTAAQRDELETAIGKSYDSRILALTELVAKVDRERDELAAGCRKALIQAGLTRAGDTLRAVLHKLDGGGK